MILVLLLSALCIMVAFRFRPGRERSPFSFYGVAPGMSVGQMRDEVGKRHGNVECHSAFDVYERCVLNLLPTSGEVVAIADQGRRLIVLQAVATGESEGLHAEADSARQAWSRVALVQSVPPLVEIGDTGAVRWTSSDQRWTAEQHFSGQLDPDPATHVILVDTRGLDRLTARSSQAEQEAKESGWTPPTAEEASAALAERKANRSSNYGALALALAQLSDFETAHFNEHHSYTDNVGELHGMVIPGTTHLEIMTASDSGWTAKASSPEFPGVSCVAAGGRVPVAEVPVTLHGRSASTSSGVVCDPMP